MEKNEIMRIIENLKLDELLNDLQNILYSIEDFFNVEIHLSLNDFEETQDNFNFNKKLELSFDLSNIENRFCELIEL